MADPTAMRLQGMLAYAFGEAIADLLRDPAVSDILVNADGHVRVDRPGLPRTRLVLPLPRSSVERVVRLVASHVGRDIDPLHPIVSAELPDGARFEGLLPPLSLGPCFAIRKHAARVFSLREYAAAGDLTLAEVAGLQAAVRDRRSILIAGGTGSGKTTFANALLAEIADSGDRLLILEDTRELQCAARDHLALRTSERTSLRDLLRASLRLRPDRIIVGEVRGGEALDLLKAWNTGHPGGVATLHANSARAALYRLEQLIEEVVPHASRPLIAEAVDLIVFLAPAHRHPRDRRRVETLAVVEGLDATGDYQLRPLLAGETSTPTFGDVS